MNDNKGGHICRKVMAVVTVHGLDDHFSCRLIYVPQNCS